MGKIQIFGELESIAVDGIVTDASGVRAVDGETQASFNERVNSRLTAVEQSSGGGSGSGDGLGWSDLSAETSDPNQQQIDASHLAWLDSWLSQKLRALTQEELNAILDGKTITGGQASNS